MACCAVVDGSSYREEWQLAAQAAFSQNCSVVTIYATLGPEGVEHGVKQTEATVVVCDGKLLKNLTAVAKNCPSLKYVVTMGDVPSEAIAKIPAGVAHEKLSDVGARGARKPVQSNPPKATDTAIIMYTSGTTGAPKVRPKIQTIEGTKTRRKAHHSPFETCKFKCSLTLIDEREL